MALSRLVKANLNLPEMIFVTAVLVVLLAAGLFLAVRELAGFKTEPEWQNVGRLRGRLEEPLPAAPEREAAGRLATVTYCRRLRNEFRSAWKLCRLLAPITVDAGYAGSLIVASVKFHALFALTLLLAAAGCSQCCERLMHRLREISSSIRNSALLILTQSDFEHGFTPA